jgi:hypothetical protein
MPGIELNRHFYQEVVRPLAEAEFPSLPYAAALIGYGSDVLGYDTPQSTDHEWGPRLVLLLGDDDHTSHAGALDKMLLRRLPAEFRGYSTGFGPPDAEGVRRMLRGVERDRRMATGEAESVKHHIQITTPRAFLRYELGIDPEREPEPGDWLSFPEQKLLEVTAGEVYHDGLGTLTEWRQRLSYYPHDVWLLLMAAQWQRISQEEAYVGRAGDVGDDLGSQLIAARLVRDVMRLCFLQSRTYAPYSKWLGTAFARLPIAPTVQPYFLQALEASEWPAREAALARAYTVAAEAHNALGLTEPLDPRPSAFHGRPYQVIHGDRFAEALKASIQDPRVRSLVEAAGLVGSVDQWIDSTDVLSAPAEVCRRVSLGLRGGMA